MHYDTVCVYGRREREVVRKGGKEGGREGGRGGRKGGRGGRKGGRGGRKGGKGGRDREDTCTHELLHAAGREGGVLGALQVQVEPVGSLNVRDQLHWIIFVLLWNVD